MHQHVKRRHTHINNLMQKEKLKWKRQKQLKNRETEWDRHRKMKRVTKKNSLKFALVQADAFLNPEILILIWNGKFHNTYLHIYSLRDSRKSRWIAQPTISRHWVVFLCCCGSSAFWLKLIGVLCRWNTGNSCRCCDNDVDANDIVVLWNDTNRSALQLAFSLTLPTLMPMSILLCHYIAGSATKTRPSHTSNEKAPRSINGRKDLQKKNTETRCNEIDEICITHIVSLILKNAHSYDLTIKSRRTVFALKKFFFSHWKWVFCRRHLLLRFCVRSHFGIVSSSLHLSHNLVLFA